MLEPGDLLLVRGDNPIDRAIEFATVSPYSHVAMLVRPGELIEAKEFHGVRLVPVSTYPKADWYRVRAGRAVRIDAARCALTRLGQPYDWADVARDAEIDFLHIDPVRRFSRNVDCAMLCWWAYRCAGVILTNRPIPAPCDLVWSPLLTRLEGN